MRQFNRFMSVAAAALLLCSTQAMAQNAGGSSDSGETAEQKEVRTFRFSEAKLEQYQNASKGIVKVMHDHPEIQKQLNAESSAPLEKDETEVDRSEKSIESHSEVSGVIKDAGLTVRGYVVMTISLINSMMVVAMKKQGVITEYPPTISKENAVFIEQHYERVKDIVQSLMEANSSSDTGDDKKKDEKK